ncbi:MAG: thioredoxin family protein, partial [Chitinophagales bacterium]|nr:thioredoxin family protein [Chitinophagales bacterium]
MTRKNFVLFTFLSLFSLATVAQILNPVKWSWKAEKLSDNEYKLIFTAIIDKGWHTYSQYVAEGGPVPTSFQFEKNADVQFIGKMQESGDKVIEAMDPFFGMVVKKFDERAVFTQKVKVLKNTTLKGSLEYMVCDESRCLPPDTREFSFDLTIDDSKQNNTTGEKNPNAVISPPADNAQQTAQPELTKPNESLPIKPTEKERFGAPIKKCEVEEANLQNRTFWQISGLGFLAGLLALLTPCVFPMIPLTVSFFTKRNENASKGKKDALLYAFSIVAIYFLLSVPFLIFDVSPDTLNEISTGAPLNIFFFIVFVIFAFSFFGYYEITLPSFIANKVDAASGVGGFIGIFFMALTLAIVSFSCTGPILGSLLVGALATNSGKLHLVAGMTSFGLALALPFGIFAFFPRLMKSLPRSGSWMNTVKVVLGFLELIFAVKFLSNADLVMHWGIIKYEVFLAIWIIIGLAMFLYFIGKLRFPHDYANKTFNNTRIALAFITLLFVGYTASGLFGNDLKLYSGFPPPRFYSVFDQNVNIHPLTDYEQALARARAENKPVMIDFTGWACVNCRKMEENVWTDPEVYLRLKEKYVLVSLYVDDRRPLPPDQQYVSPFTGKKIKTIGNKWSDMQAQYFNSNTQPFYVLISPDEKLLT